MSADNEAANDAIDFGDYVEGATWQVWSSMDEHSKIIGEGATAKEAWLCAARGWE